MSTAIEDISTSIDHAGARIVEAIDGVAGDGEFERIAACALGVADDATNIRDALARIADALERIAAVVAP